MQWNKYYKEGNQDKANELLNDMAINIATDEKADDPFWTNSAADYLTGLSLGMFEDANEDEISISTVNLMMTVGDEKMGGSTYLKEYFKGKDPASPAAINALGTINAPQDTKNSIDSVLKQKIKVFAVTQNLAEMLSRSDFDMETIGEKKTAIFMVIQDEKTTYHALATIFIKQCYESLIAVAQKHGGKLPVRTNFLIDEFANMPKFKDITTMVTAARSRGIRFTFIIQNFAQLNDVYGKEDAETIRGNCGNILYLLTGELSALEEISKLCGDKIVKVGKDKKEETRPLVTISELQRMKDDEIVLIKHRCPPFKGKMKKDWESDFGYGKGADWYGKDVEYPQREMQEIKLFDIKEFVKKQKQQKLQEAGLNGNTSNPFGGGGVNPFMNPGVNPFGDGFPPINSETNIDEMIKQIDAKIAELEKEEEEEKKKQQQEQEKEKVVDVQQPEEKVTPIEPVEQPTNNSEPKIDKVVHSNMIDFENFKIKDNKIEEVKTEQKEEPKSEEKKEEKDIDYDDFFDDFFFDE